MFCTKVQNSIFKLCKYTIELKRFQDYNLTIRKNWKSINERILFVVFGNVTCFKTIYSEGDYVWIKEFL
jgi:hypothetical protein